MQPDDTAPDGAVLIPLRRRDGSIRAYATVDADDADWVNRWRWSLSGEGYAVRCATVDRRRKSIYLHRALLSLHEGDGIEGDHRNRNRLDDRRSNLRKTDHAGNCRNCSDRGGSSSHRGVTWDAARNKWAARRKFYGKAVFFGRYDSEDDAAKAVEIGWATLMAGSPE
jgi:hypothetical protein